MSRFTRGFCIAVAASVVAHAGEPADTPKSVARAIKRGIATGKDYGVALSRAVALRAKHTDAELRPVLDAIGTAFRKSDVTPRWVALKALEDLRIAGSYAKFRKLLDVPKKVTSTSTRNLHYRAIRVAGILREDGAMGDLEKTLRHPDAGMARVAARALAGFAQLPVARKKEKEQLALRLVKQLELLERMRKKRDKKAVAYAKNVTVELQKTLGLLSGKTGPQTAAEWRAQLAG